MNLSEIEKAYKDYIEGQEPQTQNKQDKEKVWAQVQDRNTKTVRLNPVWYLAAASVSLLILSAFTFFELKQKENTILTLQNELESIRTNEVKLVNTNQQLSEELTVVRNMPPEVDTVFLTRVVYKEKANTAQSQLANNLNSQEQLPEQILDNPVEGNLTAGVESLEIEYGETTEDGITPWKFKIRYE